MAGGFKGSTFWFQHGHYVAPAPLVIDGACGHAHALFSYLSADKPTSRTFRVGIDQEVVSERVHRRDKMVAFAVEGGIGWTTWANE